MRTQAEVFYARGYALLMLKALRTAYPKHEFKICKDRLDSRPAIHLGAKAKRGLFFNFVVLYVFDEAVEEIPDHYKAILEGTRFPVALIKNLIHAAKTIQEEPCSVLDLLVEMDYEGELNRLLQTRLLLEQIEQEFTKETEG